MKLLLTLFGPQMCLLYFVLHILFQPNTVKNYAPLFNCTSVDWTSDSMMARLQANYFNCLGLELFRQLLGPRVSTGDSILLQIFSSVV